ncbi:aspartate carbamoyltransferase [Shewanella halifaxensis HAW-EB4]|uniref:Aspartate carbamoyltransferase catalytic subunit 1 n=1 Tax=Shewanella halifaxensis (strain HAW-EB4) TaxID=458817 RepID=PYRB1_SHEHH|nr:aspartate carbamoyltransferase [Shewanella halifaxensis]B0TSQ4.1 RecName: Full=Aspartate carbamoyltransferase catalytic subunit 1; AltName: Full=Aspartate transcarbamylase 1; Short=ATCase 1 [Shewanella halifaxensis HAW-EB4]ABZ75229.1 aspartate carbamoyltransferase [Shewanella halifaxensis HAW-EB4]
MSNPLYNKNIISITDLSRAELELIVSTANELKQHPRPDLLKNKVIASCFFEASTRTRLSFETAVQRLGGSVIGFPDSGNTSLGKKGETLADSVQVISSYSDAFFMRHNQEGAARLASEFSSVPVINGGDGSNQHPTQTLLDLFSIYETQGTLDKLQVAFVGDLKYGRTVHSLTQALSLFDCEFHFVAPPALSMPEYIIDELKEKGCTFTQYDSLDGVLSKLDILYMTRVQKERFDETEYQHMKSSFILTAQMFEGVKDNLKVLHPLPRVDEITTDVDSTPYAYYFQQAKNGVYARQALLALVLTNEFGDK